MRAADTPAKAVGEVDIVLRGELHRADELQPVAVGERGLHEAGDQDVARVAVDALRVGGKGPTHGVVVGVRLKVDGMVGALVDQLEAGAVALEGAGAGARAGDLGLGLMLEVRHGDPGRGGGRRLPCGERGGGQQGENGGAGHRKTGLPRRISVSRGRDEG